MKLHLKVSQPLRQGDHIRSRLKRNSLAKTNLMNKRFDSHDAAKNWSHSKQVGK
jgi:hypothetical protein